MRWHIARLRYGCLADWHYDSALGRSAQDQAADAHGFHSHTGLVVDIEEARREFGDEIASKLKLASDGRTILWPQPTNRPDDPQNWSTKKKNFLLFIMTAAAFVPDFISSCGIGELRGGLTRGLRPLGTLNSNTELTMTILSLCVLLPYKQPRSSLSPLSTTPPSTRSTT